ncbi:MAG TPA: phosphodiester glycosidase family protein, partial [Anaerolineales bacterium]|nr:phosphodiester glycosidase family protein [Anaerolineales bacterium]
MKKRRWIWVLWTPLILIGLCLGGVLIYDNGRPLPVPARERLYKGIEYERRVTFSPRPMMIHILTIDMRTSGLRFLVTPPDNKGSDQPLNARTTSQFMEEFGVQIAVNGDGFNPWWSHSLADYYPHVGDPVAPRGPTASRGKVYWNSNEPVPTLYISSRNSFSFDAPANPYNAISGEYMLVSGGGSMPDLDNTILHPRTAVGYSKNGRFLYLVVVDGRQPFYSEGITLQELANLMISIGAAYAMNLDGGGSSTMVVEGADGKPRVLNSPIDNYIPGRQRP